MAVGGESIPSLNHLNSLGILFRIRANVFFLCSLQHKSAIVSVAASERWPIGRINTCVFYIRYKTYVVICYHLNTMLFMSQVAFPSASFCGLGYISNGEYWVTE